MRSCYAIILILVLGCVAHAEAPATQPNDQPTAPLLEGLGDHHFPITTESEQAQRYFDQGLVLAYAFNHLEAERAFRETARLDPSCAMAWWGVGLVLGPHVNAAMKPEDAPRAWEALMKAKQLAPQASAKERDYIHALSARYAEKPPEDRAPLDLAYVDAMRELAKKHPDDVDAATLFAEAIMDSMPWNYWLPEGKHQPLTPELLATLEAVLAKAPQHPGANHLYIHAVEAGRIRRRVWRPPTGCAMSRPARATSCICRRTSTCGWGCTKPRAARTRKRSKPIRRISTPAGSRVFIPRSTTRTTSTSCGTRRGWKGAAPNRSAAPARRRGTSAAAAEARTTRRMKCSASSSWRGSART